MNKKDIITFNDKEYLILDTTILEEEKYLYCVGIDSEEMPTFEYIYLKGTEENNDYYVESIKDDDILEELIDIFVEQNLEDTEIEESDEQDV